MSTPIDVERYRLTVAEEVRVWLARRRMSGVKLAELIGRSQVYVSRRLRGEVPFDTDDMARVAAALNVEVVDLIPPRGSKLSGKTHDPLAARIVAVAGQDRPLRATIRKATSSRRTHRPGRAVSQTRPLVPLVRPTVTAAR